MSTLHVWTCNDFLGHYPVGTAAVVVAESEAEARRLLAAELKEHGLTLRDKDRLVELALRPRVRVLQDGEY